MSYVNCRNCGVPFHPDFIGFECKKCNSDFGECCVDDPDNFNCPICNLKVISDTTLLDFALEKLKQTREELKNDYLKKV